MREVTVLTDSSACIPSDIVQNLAIRVVPIWVIFGEDAYLDGIDITPAEFFTRLQSADPLPRTSSPSPSDYLKAFKQLQGETKSVLVITYSSRFGMAYQSACLAANQMDDLRVEVLDSKTATMAQGFVAITAARAIASGLGLPAALEVAKHTIPRVGFLAKLETLHYLSQSGRVPEIADWIGRALKLRLVFGSNNGMVSVVGASRTKKQAIRQILDELEDRTQMHKLDIAIFHAEAVEEAKMLQDALVGRFAVDEFYSVEMTPVIGAHIGPGVVGLAYCLDNPKYNP